MTESDLDLVILNRAFVILYRALILQHDFFLIVEGLLRDGVPRPRIAIPLQIHFCLCEHVGVTLERAFGLHELRFKGPGIDIDQCLAFANQLTFLVINLTYHSGDFAGDRSGINRGDRADGGEIHRNISFLRDCGGDRDRSSYGATR